MVAIMLLMVLVAVIISNHKSKIPISNSNNKIEFDISGNPIYQGPVPEECNSSCEAYFRETGIINISK